jgi:hypothetical protein
VVDKFGFANSQTVAAPALGDTQQGRAAAPGGTAAAQSSPAFRRQSAKAAAAGRNKAWVTLLHRLREQRILSLAIDDFQHVRHQCNEFEIQNVRDTLKDLMTSPDWPMQLILIGMPELIPFAKADPQLRRRIRYMKLEPVSPRSDFEFLDATIKNYAEKAELKFGIEEKDALVGRLCHAAGYQMGIAIEIVTEAIEHALDRGSKLLELVDFEEAYAARNLQANDQNPFFADAWDTIDATLVRPKLEDPEDDEPVDPKPKKRRSKRSH